MNAPQEWKKLKFGDFVENVTDRIDKPSESGLSYYVGLEHLDTEQIRIKRYGTPDDVNATKFIAKKGDIIFGKRRAYLRKVAITENDAVVSAHSMIFRPKEKIINRNFLPCFLQSDIFWNRAISISEGSLSPTIKWKTLSEQEFFIPSLNEQEKIANLLWSIEDNIECTERLIESNERLLKCLARSIFQNIKKSKKLSLMTDLVNSRGNENQYPYIEIGDIDLKYKNYIIKDKKSVKGCKKTEKDSIIISQVRPTRGAISRVINDSIFLSSAFTILVPHINYDFNYLFYLISFSEVFEEYITPLQKGGCYPTCSEKDILNFMVPDVDYKEQKKIGKELDITYESMLSLNKHLNSLNSLKKKLTDELLKGGLRLD